jgi:hypothetical protein
MDCGADTEVSAAPLEVQPDIASDLVLPDSYSAKLSRHFAGNKVKY